MRCTDGTTLLRLYERATRNRTEARDGFFLAKDSCDETYADAKERYNKAFVDWVSHRGLCMQCRTTSMKDDLTQFASV